MSAKLDVCNCILDSEQFIFGDINRFRAILLPNRYFAIINGSSHSIQILALAGVENSPFTKKKKCEVNKFAMKTDRTMETLSEQSLSSLNGLSGGSIFGFFFISYTKYALKCPLPPRPNEPGPFHFGATQTPDSLTKCWQKRGNQ